MMKFNFTITYPTTLDTLSNPTGGDALENSNNALDHASQHSDVNDAIEALEAKVGINSSAVTTSHDYKLSGVTGSDKAVSKTGTETLTNKTLTAPKILLGSDAKGDMFQLSSTAGVLARVRASSNGDIISWNSTTSQWETIANPGTSDATYTTKGVDYKRANAEYYAASATGNDTYVITLSPAPNAYVTGMQFTFIPDTANTGACTLNVNGLGAKSIKREVTSDLVTGNILAGQAVTVIYDGTNFQVAGGTSNPIVFTNGTTTKDASDASTTQNIAHGLGAIPKKVKITAFALAGDTGESLINLRQSITVYNGTTQSSISNINQGTAGVGLRSTIVTTFTLNVTNTVNADTQTGVVTFDATNIIITWTKTNAPTGTYTLLWEAEA